MQLFVCVVGGRPFAIAAYLAVCALLEIQREHRLDRSDPAGFVPAQRTLYLLRDGPRLYLRPGVW
jgi:hypothetical protein